MQGVQTAENFIALWLSECTLKGGSPGGLFLQGDAVNHFVMSVNSWGFTDGRPGLAGPLLDIANRGHASNVFALAKCSSDPGAMSGVQWTA